MTRAPGRPTRPSAPSKLIGLALAGLLAAAPAAAQDSGSEPGVTKTWAIAEFGEPLYKDGIEHWPYADPNAPKGGKIVLGAYGSFDSLNPYILKGDWPRSIGLISDSLMVNSSDELSSGYGLIAESVEYPEDKSWIIFNLRPQARFQDGVPITAADFKFAWDVIQKYGRPFLKSFYEQVEGVEVLNEHRLKFTFKTRNSMKPLLLVASFSPLAEHYWKDKDISKTTLEPWPESGPYRIIKVDPGRSITYERVPDYWGADLPVNRGLHNFDEIRFDYYRDDTVLFEAFKAGDIDFREENSSKRWMTEYDIDAVKDGRIVREEIPDETPRGLQSFMMNLRRPQFQDVRVREALAGLFDFEAIQRTLLYGKYKRSKSFFPNSDFGASGPPTPEEKALLEPYADQLPPEVLTEAFEPPVTDGSGRNREQQRHALALLKEAGWELKGGKLVDAKTGWQFKLEILSASANTERFASPYVQNLRKIGIDATFRVVDTSQYQVRIDDFDFDMVAVALNFFPPPGPELRSYFGSAAADVRGSANISGIKDPVADALIEDIVNARDLESLKAASRALDRVLLWGFYVVPHFYNDQTWVAYWNKFGHPERNPRYGVSFPEAWWIDKTLAAQLKK